MIKFNLQLFGGRGSGGGKGGGGSGGQVNTQAQNAFPASGSYTAQRDWAMQNTKAASEYSASDIQALRSTRNEENEFKLGAIFEKAQTGSSLTFDLQSPIRADNGAMKSTESWRKLKSGNWRSSFGEVREPGQLGRIAFDKSYRRVAKASLK